MSEKNLNLILNGNEINERKTVKALNLAKDYLRNGCDKQFYVQLTSIVESVKPYIEKEYPEESEE